MEIIKFTQPDLQSCFNFAYGMRGNHNANMIMERNDWEIFRDDFRGKLGEIAVLKYVHAHMPSAEIESGIDFSITPRGFWDTTDLKINNLNLNVKSIKQNSHYLFLEKFRYDDSGNYIYLNNDGKPVNVDT